MAAFTVVTSLKEALAEGIHNLSTGALKVALCAAANAPVITDSELGDLTAVSLTNLADDTLTTTSSGLDSTTYELVIADKVLTASGGSVGPFRYVVVYDDTATSDELIGFVDYGSDLTLADGETLTLNFDDAAGLLQIS